MGSSKFHLSLNVRDLLATSAFLERLLGTKPDQQHPDYVRFELADPALVLSLVPTDMPPGAGLNHLGFRLPGRQALAALEQRLAAAGIAHEREESVACCHSRQTKLWVHDPAGNVWELYALEEPGEPASEPIGLSTPSGSAPPQVEIAAATATKSWGHRLGEPLPESIAAADVTLDEVVLEGTLNARLPSHQPAALLAEAFRALRPGGRLLFRGLTSDRPLSGPPRLPGPAAAVEWVLTSQEVLTAVRTAGFVDLELLTFGETYCFEHAGALLRETRLSAWRPAAPSAARSRAVIYRGPFAELRDDAGTVYRRGEQTAIDEQSLTRLQASALAEHFIFSPAN